MNLLSYPKMSEKNTKMNEINKHTNTQKQKALNENLKISSGLRFNKRDENYFTTNEQR